MIDGYAGDDDILIVLVGGWLRKWVEGEEGSGGQGQEDKGRGAKQTHLKMDEG